MKVKNIAFSGFMAAILMGATGAHAAINVASQAYVDGKLSKKADVTAVSTLEGVVATKAAQSDLNTLTQTVADNKSSFDTYVTNNNAAVASKASQADLESLSGTVAANKQATDAAIALKADQSALTELADSVYKKTQTYTQEEVKAYVSKTLTDIGEGNISLEGYAKTQDVNNALNQKADKTQVATDIASAITSANGYTDSEIAKLSAEGGAITAANAAAAAAQGTANANAAAITVLQNKDTEIDGEIAGLKSADSAINEKIGAVTEGKTVVEMIADAKSEATYDDTALAGRVTAAEGKISANETAIAAINNEETGILKQAKDYADNAAATLDGDIANLSSTVTQNESDIKTNAAAIATNAENITKKQDALSAGQLAAANSGITAEKVSEYNAAVSELANKISMPAECKQTNGNCVLGILGGEVQWVNLTEPVDDEQSEA